MTRILAVDTSSFDLSLAIVEDDRPRHIWSKTHDHPPSDRIFVIIDEILRQEKLRVEDFDAFAACSGPGSFTGLRIGLSMAKAFAFATDKPVFAIDAVEMQALSIHHALGAQTPGAFWVVVQGYRDTTFCGHFRIKDENPIREGGLVWCEGDEELARRVPKGLPVILSRDARVSVPGAALAPETQAAALSLARRAALHLETGFRPPLEAAQPLYLKPFNVGKKARRPEDFRS